MLSSRTHRKRILWAAAVLGLLGAAAWACTLNPQPLPPESAAAEPGAYDAGGSDSSALGRGDGTGGGTLDSSPPPSPDAGSDAPQGGGNDAGDGGDGDGGGDAGITDAADGGG
jgi:hypothetical protein